MQICHHQVKARPVNTIKEAEIVMVEMHFDALRAISSKTRVEG